MEQGTTKLAAFFDSASLADRAGKASMGASLLSVVAGASLLNLQFEAAVVSASMATMCVFGNRLFRKWQDDCLVEGYQPTQGSMQRAAYSIQNTRNCGVY